MKKELRLKKSADFKIVLDNKKFISCKSMVIYYKKQDLGHMRIGLSVGKKMGKAVIRNKIKRQLRSMCQELINFDLSYDFIILARLPYNEQDFLTNKKDLEKIYKKVIIKEGLFKGENNEYKK